MHLGFVIKKTLTLLALVDPFMAIPLFVCATAGLDVRFRDKYSRQLGITVALSLLIGGLFGLHLLDFMVEPSCSLCRWPWSLPRKKP